MTKRCYICIFPMLLSFGEYVLLPCRVCGYDPGEAKLLEVERNLD